MEETEEGQLGEEEVEEGSPFTVRAYTSSTCRERLGEVGQNG
jgi:hypothetical protein